MTTVTPCQPVEPIAGDWYRVIITEADNRLVMAVTVIARPSGEVIPWRARRAIACEPAIEAVRAHVGR